jgi:PhoPQ-activated pathogenicity-related protein
MEFVVSRARQRTSRFALVVLAGVAWALPAWAGLVEYVKKPDPTFAWKLTKTTANPQGTIYDIELTSQTWEGIPWEHALQIYLPKDVSPNHTMFLWNTGGKPGLKDIAFSMLAAQKIKAPCAFLYGIPKQPLFDGKKEDTPIAETFVRFLKTRDEEWPLLFPMAKSVVRAMDVIQAFSQQEWHHKVERFVVSGASKRGWTTWLTAAADPRVLAIAPMVIDTLNMKAQNAHQIEAYGQYSKEIDPYTDRGLVPMPNTPEARKLWTMVDPYHYRDKLVLPKMIINGANDPYWTVDALNLYWNDLQGDKWVLYVPNAGHNLQQQTGKGSGDVTRAVNGLAAFTRAQMNGKSMPRMTWKHEDVGGKLRLMVESSPAPRGARLWVADAPTQDFRKSKWAEQPARLDGAKVVGEVAPPAEGCRTFFAELDYSLDGLDYHLSTQVRVCGHAASSASK